jgi:hypothetical protein
MIPLLIAAGLMAFPAEAKYSGGTGEPNDPYQIATAADLIALGETPEDYDKHFILTDDIDLDPNLPGRKVFDNAVIARDVNEANWEFDGTPFTGTFDGSDHAISHLTIAGKGYLGLFGQLTSEAEVKDLSLADINITGSGNFAGALVARNDGGIVARCHSTGVVRGNWFVGGLVGFNEGSIAMSYSTAAIHGTEPIGGLVGHNNGAITRSYSTGTVSGFWEVGGLVGGNGGSIVASYSTGPVTGGSLAGGLVGYNYFRGSIAASYSTSAVNGDSRVGGLVGYLMDGEVGQCYSVGAVSGKSYVGGLVGTGAEGTGVTNCLWDTQASGQAASEGGVGMTTAEMQTAGTYLDAGWDFTDENRNGTCDYWQISPGDYPRLRCFAGDSPMMPEGSGTAEQPYLIRSARDLGTIWSEPTAYYRLAASVDLSEITWSMAVVPWLGGTFDGNHCAIHNLHIRGGGPLGLFGRSGSGSVISNLDLGSAEVTGTGSYVGALVGVSMGMIVGCHSTGVVSGAGSEIGGLVGQNCGSIAASRTAGAVTGSGDAGRVGGLVGYNYYHASIGTSHSTGAVNGSARVGGLVGSAYGSIASCYSTGAVSGGYDVGGLLGAGEDLESITCCYSTSAVCGDEAVGGLAGYIDTGEVSDCYSIGAVRGNDRVGGLVGYTESCVMSRCYSASAVGGRSDVGGLVGIADLVTATDCLWDTQACGLATGGGGIGKTTAEMQTAATFLTAGWDFVDETANGSEDIWWIDEGKDYPRLWWEAHD